MKKVLISIILIAISLSYISGQCHEDRHNTQAFSGWISCEKSENPSSNFGNTHWVMLDLGGNHTIHDIQIWNMNHPDFRNAGFKDFIIDYSLDSITWTSIDTYTISRAPASSQYLGRMVVDLGGIDLRYIVFTPISNYGGQCYGLSEVKLFTSDQSVDDYILEFEVCETDGIIDNLTSGFEEGGIYSGPGVVDNGDETFSFNTDYTGPGKYWIDYTVGVPPNEEIHTSYIQVLGCEDEMCGDCPDCKNYSNAQINADPIPTKTYRNSTVTSTGVVRPNKNVVFRGRKQVTLNPGFEVDDNVPFLAEIRTCYTNQIDNHSFEDGFDDWYFVTSGVIGATKEIVTDAYEGDQAVHFHIPNINIQNGEVQGDLAEARSQYHSLIEGREYELNFAAKADDERIAQVMLEKTNSPYTDYLSEKVNLKTYWKKYTFRFVATTDLDFELRFRFLCSFEVGDYYLDNVNFILLD